MYFLFLDMLSWMLNVFLKSQCELIVCKARYDNDVLLICHHLGVLFCQSTKMFPIINHNYNVLSDL